MIPAAVVAALFGIQDDIFGIKKQFASFVVATIILYAVMRITSIMTFLLRRFVSEKSRLALLLLGQLDRLENKQPDR